eukprot:scaffold1916_cov394-Pavlova_lutheri.AAC.1
MASKQKSILDLSRVNHPCYGSLTSNSLRKGISTRFQKIHFASACKKLERPKTLNTQTQWVLPQNLKIFRRASWTSSACFIPNHSCSRGCFTVRILSGWANYVSVVET